MKHRLAVVGISVGLLLGIGLSFSNAQGTSTLINVTTQRYGLNRNSVNTQETILNTSNVNQNQFGLLFTDPVVGDIYNQPLIVTGVNIPDKGTHNVVYFATMHNNVYAFDADQAGAPLWTVNLGAPFTVNVNPPDIPGGEDGVLSTPVIDTKTNTMYLVSHHDPDGKGKPAQHEIHALDITTGAEKFGGPVVITGAAPGTDIDSAGGVISYDAHQHLQRPALALANGKVFVAMGSTGNQLPYHGWLFAYSANNLKSKPAVWLSSPQNSHGGIWMAGNGPVIDENGYIYVATGNGSFNVNDGGLNYGDSFVKLRLNPNNTFRVVDYFTPWNKKALDEADLDLGVSGIMMIPGTHFLFGGGKTPPLYVVNADKMGHYKADSDSQIVQEWEGRSAGHMVNTPNIWTGPNGTYAYITSEFDPIMAYEFKDGKFNTTPVSTSPFTNNGMPSGVITVSSNGTTPGTGIVWTTDYLSNFRALDATDLTKELWQDSDNPDDELGVAGKFVPPTVANGKVYMATRSGRLAVYGLLPTPPPGGSLNGLLTSPPEAVVDLTAEGTLDWEHWGIHTPTDVDRKAKVTPLISKVTETGYGPLQYEDNATRFSWTDGTPNAGGNTITGIFGGLQDGLASFQITVPADTTSRILKVYVGLNQAQGQFGAFLSDRSAAPFSGSLENFSGNTYGVFALSYKASSPGQTLTVRWKMSAGAGTINFQAASLTLGSALPTQTPVPAQ